VPAAAVTVAVARQGMEPLEMLVGHPQVELGVERLEIAVRSVVRRVRIHRSQELRVRAQRR